MRWLGITAGIGWSPTEGKQDKDTEAKHPFWFKKQGGLWMLAESLLKKSIFLKGFTIFKYSSYALLHPRSASGGAVRLCQQQNIRHSSVTQNKTALICRFQLLVHLLCMTAHSHHLSSQIKKEDLCWAEKEQISIESHASQTLNTSTNVCLQDQINST